MEIHFQWWSLLRRWSFWINMQAWSKSNAKGISLQRIWRLNTVKSISESRRETLSDELSKTFAKSLALFQELMNKWCLLGASKECMLWCSPCRRTSVQMWVMRIVLSCRKKALWRISSMSRWSLIQSKTSSLKMSIASLPYYPEVWIIKTRYRGYLKRLTNSEMLEW